MQNASKITKNNSQGIMFVTISCQRVTIWGFRAIWHVRSFIMRDGETLKIAMEPSLPMPDSEVRDRGWLEGVGNKQDPKHSNNAAHHQELPA